MNPRQRETIGRRPKKRRGLLKSRADWRSFVCRRPEPRLRYPFQEILGFGRKTGSRERPELGDTGGSSELIPKMT